MVINTGSRTDIPAFYTKWFINRVKAGFVLVRNPYRPDWITRYELDPRVVDALVFCTKNPAPLLSHIGLLKPFGQYWFVTITPYGSDIEPNVPPKERVMDSFIELSRAVGPDSVGWRYDPIFINSTYTLERHIADFETMAARLSGFTHTCVISFIDLYDKVKTNFPGVQSVTREQRNVIGQRFIEIAGRYGMTIKPCAEGAELEKYGADCSGCLTAAVLEQAIGERLIVPNTKPARPECSCILGADIGAYDTCGHFCRYCYANANRDNVRRNMRLHDPSSPLLVGSLYGGEVHAARQESWIDSQLSLF